jgi:hypothetical protein
LSRYQLGHSYPRTAAFWKPSSGSGRAPLTSGPSKHDASKGPNEDHDTHAMVSSPTTKTPLPRQGHSGWRKALVLAICASVTILGCNVAFGVWALLHGELARGIGTLAEGQCSIIANHSLFAHLLINAASTTLLGASNYTMQCLAAPVREDIDRAHQRGDWLDIGIPSLRNLKRIHKKRAALVVVLAISSIPLHLL